MKHSIRLLNESILGVIKSEPKAKCLLWLDENIDAADLAIDGTQSQLDIVSNRIDDIDVLTQNGFQAEFSDFQKPKVRYKYDYIFYRISKEKLVTHRCINLSLKVLKSSGQLILIGRKEDGIKTYVSTCQKKLNASGKTEKDKSGYCARLSFKKDSDRTLLDDGAYETLRVISNAKIGSTDYDIYAKPGVYGWKKLDVGSMFLIGIVSTRLSKLNVDGNQKALDLGCGSGLLSLALHEWGFKHIVATDNNAAAIAATKKTLKSNRVKAETIASDAGNSLEERFDFIICNPPFHKGFETDKALSEKFVIACKKRLRHSGTGFFVCNAFVNIEKPLFTHGLAAKQIANNKQFKVLQINHR